MNILLKIFRGTKGNGFYQTFRYESNTDADTIATALTELNAKEPLTDIEGKAAEPILWECNCLQKRCGACAMVINKKPALACSVMIRTFQSGSTVLLEPLKKFPGIRDLAVDREAMTRNLGELSVWLAGEDKRVPSDVSLTYEASRCLQCGCCLEVCPNFAVESTFTGMAAAVPLTRILGMEGINSDKAKGYEKRVFEGCGKSLACRDICPAGIDIERMLVNSNAIAVWKRMRKIKEEI